MRYLLCTHLFTLLLLGAIGQLHAQNSGRPATGPASTTEAPDDSINVIFFTQADSALVILDKRYLEPMFISHRDSIRIPRKKTFITVSSPYVAERTLHLTFPPNSNRYNFNIDASMKDPDLVVQNSLFARYTTDANLTVYTDPDTEIYLGGRRLGRSFIQQYLPPKEYKLILKTPGNKQKKMNIQLKETFMTVVEERLKPVEFKTRLLSVIPSASQFYTGRTKRGFLYAGVTAMAAASFISFQSSLNDNTSTFNNTLVVYNRTIDENQALALGNQLESLESKIDRNRNLKNISLWGLVALPVVSFLDQWFFQPERGYQKSQKPVEVQFYSGSVSKIQNKVRLTSNLQMRLKINF